MAAAAALSFAYSRLQARLDARLGAGLMDGTAWEIKVKPDAFLAFSRPDTLIFSEGRVSVAGWLSSGFATADYQAISLDQSGEAVFNAILTHDKKGVMNWQGVVHGDAIQGIAVLWGNDGRSQRFIFRGTRKAPSGGAAK